VGKTNLITNIRLARLTLSDVGETMLKHGMSPEDIVDCLDAIRGAVADEYGD
jgi:hypothetical protein